MSGLPTGTVTFLFTDIEGSTKLWEQYPEAMRDALSRHDALLQQAIEAHGGYVFKAVRLRAPVVVVCRSNWVVVELLRIHAGVAEMLIDHHQAIRITERKRAKQDRTHHGE